MRVFTIHKTNTQRSYRPTQGKDLEIGVFREFFQMFLEANKIKLETVNYEVVNKRHGEASDRRAVDLEI